MKVYSWETWILETINLKSAFKRSSCIDLTFHVWQKCWEPTLRGYEASWTNDKFHTFQKFQVLLPLWTLFGGCRDRLNRACKKSSIGRENGTHIVNRLRSGSLVRNSFFWLGEIKLWRWMLHWYIDTSNAQCLYMFFSQIVRRQMIVIFTNWFLTLAISIENLCTAWSAPKMRRPTKNTNRNCWFSKLMKTWYAQ